MKTKLSKKLLSLFLAVLMLATSIPFTGMAEDFTSEAYGDGYTLSEAYKAEYADPTNNAIKKVVDPIYRNNFVNGLDDFNLSDSSAVTLASAGERTQTMRIGAATSAPGHYAEFKTNPFKGKDLSNGATIMGWNYYTVDKSSVDYVPFITFYGRPTDGAFLAKHDISGYTNTNEDDNYWYVSFTLGGYILISKGAVDKNENYTNYCDYMIDGTQDIVGIPYTGTTITTKKTATWTHYAFTVTENAIKVYIAGIEYTFSASPGAGYDQTQLENFNYVLDYLTLDSTKASYSYGLGYWYANYDHFFDDVRFYDTALTQQQIRAIYGENDEAVYKYAEGHDPTIVYNETKQDGEFSYYMFGTGMTIYGSDDLANWYELADDQGRTGYQSTKLFGDTYTNVLGASGTNKSSAGGAMPLVYSAGGSGITNNSTGTGAGLMVWAPSVIYNTTTGKWQMFAATSSWGSPVSCIFVAEADSIEGPYTDIYTLMYSGYHDNGCNNGYANVNYYTSNHRNYLNQTNWLTGAYEYKNSEYPNCIDAAPFYDAKGELWMSYGSWSGGIFLVKLTADGRYLDNGNAGSGFDIYYGKKIAATSAETYESSLSGSSEGSFIYYDATTGYYYLTISYGAVHTGRYTMRTWRSGSVGGDYVDAMGISALTASTNYTRSGMKLMGNYSIPGANTHYYDNGHSSNLYVPTDSGTGEDGKSFISYHMRTFDGYRSERAYSSSNYLNEARVHQVLFNQDGWQCILPYQYSGETFGSDGFIYSVPNLAGTWSFLLFNEKVDTSKATTVNIRLNANGTVEGNYNGTWELVMVDNKPYLNLNLSIDENGNIVNVEFKGVFITMVDETGNTHTVFSAAGETNGYKTTAWGVMQDALPPASSATDSELSMIASDGYDNIIYTHGNNDCGNWGAGSSSDYMFFGDDISDGTVPPTVNSSYKYEAEDGVSVANNTGYEQGERATYIYIKDTYTVNTTAGAITADNNANSLLTATLVDSDREGYNKYIVSGTITGAGTAFSGESDDTKRFINTTLTVPYTSANGVEYTEHIYATVMPNPVSANAMTAVASDYTSWFTDYYRDTSAFLRADGSTGTVVSIPDGSNEYIGNYAWLDNPVYVSGLTGKAFAWFASDSSNGIYLVAGGASGGGTSVNKAGAYVNKDYSNSSSHNETSTTSGTVTANYYLDLSKLTDSATQELGGLTVDTANQNISFDLIGTELNGLNSATNRYEYFELADGSNFSWGNHYSTFTSSVNNTSNNKQYHDPGTKMMYDTSTISGSYASVSGNAATSLQTLTDTATFRRTHEQLTANAVIGISVKVFDKSAIYDRLDEFDNLVQTDYTEETWADLEEALKKATFYCNNYKLFNVDTDGATIENPAEYMQQLSNELDYAYNDLFSYDEFINFKDIYELALQVQASIVNDTLTDPSAKDALDTAIQNFGGYAFITAEDQTTSEINNDTFYDIAAKGPTGEITTGSANYNNGQSTGDPAKLAYNAALNALIDAINNVKSLTEYNELELTLYGTDSGTNVNDGTAPAENSSADVVNKSTDDAGELKPYNDGQAYTLESWADFDAAYDAAVGRYTESGTEADTATYRQTEYKYASVSMQQVPVYSNYNEATHEYTTETRDVSVQGTDLSAEQLSIDAATAELTEARGNLQVVDSQEAYNAYNGAQQWAELADVDAYNEDIQVHILTNFARGYINADGEVVNAADYDGTNDSAVFVTLNGKVYYNTTTGETDPITTDVLNTMNTNTNRKLYNVYFNVYIDGEAVTDANANIGTGNPIEKHYFGESVTFDGSAYNTYDLAKWVVNSKNATGETKTTVIKTDDYTIEREIQQDTTVDLYLTTPATGAVKVTVIDYFGTRLDTGYVTLENDIFVHSTADDNSLVYADVNGRQHTVAVNENALYTFNSWYWTFTSDDNSTITVIQRGTKEVPTGGYSVKNGTVNGETSLSDVALNTVLTFTTTDVDFVAWLKTEDSYTTPNEATWYVASYNAEFSTLSRDTIGFTYVAVNGTTGGTYSIGNYITDTAELADIQTKFVPYSYGTATQTINGNTKFRLYCDYTVDNGSTAVVQYGVVCAKGTPPTNFVKGGEGVYTFPANAASDYNTYTMTTSVKSETVYMRSFVSYMYTDENGNEIPRVTYGPVYQCDSSGNISKVSQ